MEKFRVKLNDSVLVGSRAPTALNVLIGLNTAGQYTGEIEKIEILNKSELPVSIITDLSIGTVGKGRELWRQVVNNSRFVAGTVPVYQAVNGRNTIDKTYLLELIKEQAENGVKLITIHPTPNFDLMEMSKSRNVPITSRGGAAVCMDMIVGQKSENVYLQILDELIQLAVAHEVTLSIGSSFRSANIQDAMDKTYLFELSRQLEIANYCKERNVNVIIETPGHAAPQDIFKICEKLDQNCPFPIMPLGPLPIDCAFEQDDLAGAMGAVLMGTRGCADILTVVTKEEHTGGIPTIDSIVSAVEKYSIAKHIIDVYKLNDVAADNRVSIERSNRGSCIFGSDIECLRCGRLCPLRLAKSIKCDLFSEG